MCSGYNHKRGGGGAQEGGSLGGLPVRSMVMGPGACSDTSVSLVTCTCGWLASGVQGDSWPAHPGLRPCLPWTCLPYPDSPCLPQTHPTLPCPANPSSPDLTPVDPLSCPARLHTFACWQGSQKCPFIGCQALVRLVQLLNLLKALSAGGPVLGQCLIQCLISR